MLLREFLVESEQDLFKEIKIVLKGGWRLSPSGAIGALVAAVKPQAIEDLKKGDMYAYAILSAHFGQHSLPVKEMMSILQKYASKPHTHPFVKGYYQLADDEKSQIESKYAEYHKNKTKFWTLITYAPQNFTPTTGTPGKPKKPSGTLKPGDANRPDIMDPPDPYDSYTDPYATYTSPLDDAEEILGQRYHDFSRKMTEKEISDWYKSVTVVTVDYDVFDWNLRLLGKLNLTDKKNNLSDPILQLGIMGEPRVGRSAKQAQNRKQLKKYPERKVIARFGNVDGILGAAYGGPRRTDTIIAGHDQLLSYHPARAVQTDAHEIRHRAFNVMSLIPEIRNNLPADLRPGGKWWGSYGASKYMDFDKIDFSSGAWAEHALIYAIDYGEGTTPDRRIGFFDNAVFNTKDYPISYWKNLYYQCMPAVAKFLKDTGAEKRMVKPKPLNYFNRPPMPGDNLDISNSFAPYIKFNPGLPEMYRHMLETGQIDTLEEIESAFTDDGLQTWSRRLRIDAKLRKAIDAELLVLERSLYNGNFAAAKKLFPTQIQTIQKLADDYGEGDKQYIINLLERLNSSYQAISKLKNVETLYPEYWAEKIASGEIKPATNFELRKLLPYTMADYSDYKSQMEKGAQPIPGLEPKRSADTQSREYDYDRDFLAPSDDIKLEVPTIVYGRTVSSSEHVQAEAVGETLAYLLGIIPKINNQIPFPANYNMDKTIKWYNDYYSGGDNSWNKIPGMPDTISSNQAAKIKQAYEDAKNGKEPEFIGIDNIPAPKPTAEPTAEPESEPATEPKSEPKPKPTTEPESEPTTSSDEAKPIEYRHRGTLITTGFLPYVATTLVLERIVTGKKSASWDIWEDNMPEWPGDFNINAAINFYNQYMENNPEDFSSRSLPKKIGSELRRDIIQKYKKIRSQGELT